MRPAVGQDPWQKLEIYRQRYDIEDMIDGLPDLALSLQRRERRRAALTRRRIDLEEQLSKVEAEVAAIDRELEGSREAWNLMIEDVIERVRETHQEGWSPTPVRGFRVWRIADNRIKGNQIRWSSPSLTAVCLRGRSGEDIPHPIAWCGPPPCGIYAVKSLDMFPTDVASGQINDSVVGVVGFTGKVIEHTAGYRGRHATVIAVSATSGGRNLLTANTDRIVALFDDPAAAIRLWGRNRDDRRDTTREFLESVRAKEKQWT